MHVPTLGISLSVLRLLGNLVSALCQRETSASKVRSTHWREGHTGGEKVC